MFVTCVFLWASLQIAVQSAGLFGLTGLVNYDGFKRICLCRCGVLNTERGQDSSVAPHEYPWLAAIYTGSKVLAGSLISDNHILTAASPFYGLTPDSVTVSLGAHDRCSVGDSGMNMTVDSIVILPGFSPSTLENDLALIKLKHVVTFSNYVSPICLPLLVVRDDEKVTWTAGWSQTNGNCTPRVAALPRLTSATCDQVTGNKQKSNDKGCLGPLGVKNVICKDDVGSPVMATRISSTVLRLIGVISTSSCEDTTPPIYTNVLDHVGWINEYLKRDCSCV